MYQNSWDSLNAINYQKFFFQNEWSSRLVEGGDGYIPRNLNDLNVQRTIPLDVDKMT